MHYLRGLPRCSVRHRPCLAAQGCPPLDQFRAFLALREKGQSGQEIAAAFFVSVAVVKQRLRLAFVSPRLLDLYAGDGLTLDQLMALTVNSHHARQEQVWEALLALVLQRNRISSVAC
jgi:hypothetical protein